MEIKTTSVLAAVVAAMMLTQTFALPMGQNGQPNQDALPAEKRPKYLETRDMTYLKELILASLVENKFLERSSDLSNNGRYQILTKDFGKESNLLIEVFTSNLIDEGIVSPMILTEPKVKDEAPSSAQKRERHIGVCFHLTPSGHPVPKICWKNDYN